MNRRSLNRSRRILVTGSRGKSSVVRLLHAALCGYGLEAKGRITGVVPRELTPRGERQIFRTAGAHVEEMRWWLGTLGSEVNGIVLENSAVSPELQPLAARWLAPELVVLTNSFPDHQESWGPGVAAAARALAEGIPGGSTVVVAGHCFERTLAVELERRRCQVVVAATSPGDHHAINRALATAALDHLGLDCAAAHEAMAQLPPDPYDFRVVECAGAELALAFSANDPASTEALFASLGWQMQETRLLYNHRSDRPGRLAGFLQWLRDSRWREVLVVGDPPPRSASGLRTLPLVDAAALKAVLHPGEQLFGCGNIAGAPLELIQSALV